MTLLELVLVAATIASPQSVPFPGPVMAAATGGPTILKVNSNSCYVPSTTCQLTSVVSGNLIIAFGGVDSGATAPTISGDNCSAQGSTTGTFGVNAENATVGMWCLANSTTVTVTVATVTADSGIEMVQFSSSTGWATAGMVQNQTPDTASTLTPPCPSVTRSGTAVVAMCYVLNENDLTTYSSANGSYLAGPIQDTHSDASVYYIGAGGTLAPTITFTGTAKVWAAQAIAIAAN